MFSVLSQIVVPLLTIAFSGLLSAYITHHLAATKADKEFQLRKLEELYAAVSTFCTNYSVTMLPLLPAMRGAMSYAEVEKAVHQYRDNTAGKQLDTAEMLIRIYFPDLRPRFE